MSAKSDNIDSGEASKHIGEILKAVREERKLKLVEISKELMIRRFYLQAIEDGDFKELPAKVYSIGFIRTYSNYLGVDSDEAVRRFLQEAYSDRTINTQPELSFPDPVDTGIMPDRRVLYIGGAVLILLLLSLPFITGDEEENIEDISSVAVVEETAAVNGESIEVEEEEQLPDIEFDETDTTATTVDEETTLPNDQVALEVQDTPEATVETEAVVEKVEEVAQEAIEAPAPQVRQNNYPSRITIKAVEDSWVEIRGAGGKIILTRVLKEGQEYRVPDASGLTMSTGNIGGLRVFVDGDQLTTLGPRGAVMRDIRLVPSSLMNRQTR